MTKPRPLALTTMQVEDAVERLDGVRLLPHTLKDWASSGLMIPSIRYNRRHGIPGTRLYSLSDLARIRLIARLRRAKLSTQRIRTVLAFVDAELPDVLTRDTKAVLVVNGMRGVIVRQRGQADIEIPSGQLRLPLVEVVRGNTETAAAILAAA